MIQQTRIDPPLGSDPDRTTRRRSPWRRRLIDAERGITLGFRSDSAFFVYFFAGCVVVAAAAVLGLELWQWIAVVLSLNAVLTAELFHQALRLFFQSEETEASASQLKAQRLASAAVFATLLGACVIIGLVLGRQVWDILC